MFSTITISASEKMAKYEIMLKYDEKVHGGKSC